MSKLSLFDMCVVSNYIRNRTDYLNVMMTSTKFKSLNEYFNQFKSVAPFNDRVLFGEEIVVNKDNYLIFVYDDEVSTDFDETKELTSIYFNLITSLLMKYITKKISIVFTY